MNTARYLCIYMFAFLLLTIGGCGESSERSILEASDFQVTNVVKQEVLSNAGFSILRSGGSCPAGFDAGVIEFDTEDSNTDDRVSGFAGDIEEKYPGMHLYACTTKSSGVHNLEAMKTTDFAVLKKGDCPEDYLQGTLKFDTEDDHNDDSLSGDTGSAYLLNHAVYFLVCQSNGDSDLSKLLNGTFSVFKNGECPKGSSEGTIKFDTEDYDNKDSSTGNIGSSSLSTNNKSSIYLRLCTFGI